MKIIYIVPAFPTGGAEKFLVSLANGLTASDVSQEVISLSDRNPLAAEFLPEIRFTAIPRSSKLSKKAQRALRDKLIQARPDIIFCLNMFSYAFYRLAARGLTTDARVYISYHNTDQVSFKEELLHRLYFGMVRKTDRILMVCGNQLRHTLKRYRPRGKKHAYIYNGIDCTRWSTPPDGFERLQSRQALGLPTDGKIIILAAAFRREKNHAGAVEALKYYHETWSDKPYLLLVGDGPESAKVRALVQSMDMDKYVIFAGLQKDLRPYYWSSDLFTLASTRVETFSIAALEAMSCGLPSVLTRIGGADEMVFPGINGDLSETTPKSIAHAWHRAFENVRSSPAEIHQIICNKFSLPLMVDSYQKSMGI